MASIRRELPGVNWWLDVVGLAHPFEDERLSLLDNDTVCLIVDNLSEMGLAERTRVTADLLPFMGAFAAQSLRAIQMAHEAAGDEASLMQVNTEAKGGPFGSVLLQVKAHLDSVEDEKGGQAARCFKRMIEDHVRSSHGALTPAMLDHIQRLQALVASYQDKDPAEGKVRGWCVQQWMRRASSSTDAVIIEDSGPTEEEAMPEVLSQEDT